MVAPVKPSRQALAQVSPDRHSQAMSLDERTVAVYSALDSVTLLGLLPALRSEAERAKDEADMFDRARLVIPEQTTAQRAQGDLVVARDRRPEEAGVPEHHAPTRAPRERATSDSELSRVLERLDSYRADLLERERWIRGDLVRRGLLPEYPYWGERLTGPHR
jgi:hypothetical protein